MSVIRGRHNGEQVKGKMPGSDSQGEKERKKEPAEGSRLNTTSLPSFIFFEKRDGKLRSVYACATHLSLSLFILARVEAESIREVSKNYGRDNRRFKVSSDS